MTLPAVWAIPLVAGSPREDMELRYMLRGLAKHHPGASPLVVGHRPRWYTGPHLDFRELPQGCKENKIRLKLAAACEATPGGVVFANDDHFLVKPFTGLNYYSGDLKLVDECLHGGPYKATIKNTAAVTGWHFKYFDVHTPLVIDSALFLSFCDQTQAHWAGRRTMLLKSYYAYYAGLLGTKYTDIKIDAPLDFIELVNLVQHREIFSTGDNFITRSLLRLWNSLYPERSPWE